MSDKYSTVEERVSYGIGQQMGEQLLASAFEGMSSDVVLEGIKDFLDGKESAIDEDTLHAAYTEIASRVKAQKEQEHQALAQEGVDFLAENANREEVVVLDSGVQYEVLVEGEGEKPTLESVVKTHYRGTLIDGTLFDSSYERGQPTEFPVKGVIQGWQEILQHMPVGAKYKVFIPYQHAYGEMGAGEHIKPFSTLIFEMELIEILAK
jgi:FKBP-type peptidyl-prolyl cis-trans isomerase FklB